jgi:hypothetical protein
MPVDARRTMGVLLLVFALLAAPASAQTADETNCRSDNADLSISGCTAAISSGQESDEDLAVLYDDRGTAYLDKRLYDQAFADYDHSIALNPAYALAYNIGRVKLALVREVYL